MLAHRSNAQWHRPPNRTERSTTSVASQESPSSSGVSPPPKKRLPVPPRPSLKRRNNSSQPISIGSPLSGPGFSSLSSERPRSPDETRPPCGPVSSSADHIPMPSGISNQHGQVVVSPEGGCDRSIAPRPSSAAEEEMSEMTLNYLRR